MSISEKRIFRSYGMITMGTFLMALGTCLIYEPMSMVTGGFQVWELYLKNYLESRCLL